MTLGPTLAKNPRLAHTSSASMQHRSAIPPPAALGLALALLLPAAASAAAPQSAASPSPAPSATPALRLIAHIHATTVRCAKIAVHANAAIGAALEDDTILAQAIEALRSVDLDGGTLARTQGLHRLQMIADNLAHRAREGDLSAKRLRVLAEQTKDPAARAALVAFANEIGGAIGRQRKINRNLDGFIAAMYAKGMARDDEATEQMNLATTGRRSSIPGKADGMLSVDTTPAPIGAQTPDPYFPILSDSMYARSAARDFTRRMRAVQRNEAQAAKHVGAIAQSC